MYSPSIIIDVLEKKLKRIKLTSEAEGVIKTVIISKVYDEKNENRMDVFAHYHNKDGVKSFKYKNASHAQIKENLDWL